MKKGHLGIDFIFVKKESPQSNTNYDSLLKKRNPSFEETQFSDKQSLDYIKNNKVQKKFITSQKHNENSFEESSINELKKPQEKHCIYKTPLNNLQEESPKNLSINKNSCPSTNLQDTKLTDTYFSMVTRSVKMEYKQKLKEYSQEFIIENKEKLIEYSREYKRKNKEKVNKRNKEYKRKNREKINEYSREYKRKNREKINECNREYKRKKKEERLRDSEKPVRNVEEYDTSCANKMNPKPHDYAQIAEELENWTKKYKQKQINTAKGKISIKGSESQESNSIKKEPDFIKIEPTDEIKSESTCLGNSVIIKKENSKNSIDKLLKSECEEKLSKESNSDIIGSNNDKTESVKKESDNKDIKCGEHNNVPDNTNQDDEIYKALELKIKKENRKKYAAKQYQKNKEKVKLYAKEYRKNNMEKKIQYWKKYRLENKEKIREYSRGYRLANKELTSSRSREYKRKNVDRYNSYQRQYKQKNKEKVNERNREYKRRKKEMQKQAKAEEKLLLDRQQDKN